MPQADNGIQARRQAWLVLVMAFAMANLCYGAVLYMIAKSRATVMLPARTPSPTLLGFLAAAGILCLLASAGWVRRRTAVFPDPLYAATSTDPLPSPSTFQADTMVGLALAEACSIFGFVRVFMGAPFASYAAFAAGSLLVMLLYILPRGLACWAAYEKRAGRSG